MSDDNIVEFRRASEQPHPSCVLDLPDGKWFKYGVKFTVPTHNDHQEFAVTIWARDLADAQLRVDALRSSASLIGQIFGEVW